MPARLYRDFIKIDSDFIPVFSSSSDRVYPDKWQSFYPHDSFKKILTSVVEMLEKSSTTKDLPQWMSGAYGTGKTYASFTIKHILEDPLERVEPYFTQNKMTSLLARVKGVRAKGDILVVHNGSSSGIDTPNKLYNAITASVRKALADKGCPYLGSKSRYDKVLETLKDPDSSFNFAGAFRKYKARFMDYAEPQQVIEDLEELPREETLDLLDTVVQIAEEENYNWSSTPEEVIDWLEDVRKGNGLYAIVMMWDEFTEFFKNNQNNITGLQDIAQAASRISFYFFLITHSDVNQLIADQSARKIMQARFVSNRLTLGENAAFTLLGQALRPEPDLEPDWNGVKDKLWASVARGAAKHIEDKDTTLRDADFKNLFPMHPYASYLLKFIAQDISSNQRTMFQFMSGDYADEKGDRTNFRWFIDHFGFEHGKWNLLTPDYLWDYFFYAENVDLDGAFMDAISHYNNFEGICGAGETGEYSRKVLKVALLLSAIHTKNASTSRSGTTSLLRPTGKNIGACFVGTPLENRVVEILQGLSAKGVLGAVADGNDTLYVITPVAVDKERMDQMEAETRRTFSFEKIIEDPSSGVAKSLLPMGKFMAARYEVRALNAGNARMAVSKFNRESNRISVVYLFAKNEAEQGKTAEAIRKIYADIPERCIVVDLTAVPLTDDRYEKFIKSKAQERYFQKNPNQKDQMKLAKTNAERVLQEWDRLLGMATIHVYASQEKSYATSGGRNLRQKLMELNTDFFGAGLEEILQHEKLFERSGFTDVVGKIAMGKAPVPATYSCLNQLSARLEKDGIWSDPNYWKDRPEHAVSKMKTAVEDVIQRGFKEKSMVCVTDIWKVLTKAPFGLLPCTGADFLMAFLLKDYADSKYYKQDINNNTVALNYADLSELIYGVIKGLPKAKDQYIVQQKPEHASFCQITGDIFKIATDKRNSISDISKNLNIYLSNNGYPLWSLVSYVDEELEEHPLHDALIQLIELLCEFVNPEQKIARDKTKIAEEVNDLYLRNSGVDAALKQIVTSECLRQGMVDYIALQKPKLKQIAGRLKIESNEYLSLLQKKLSKDASYLWQKGDIDHQIDKLFEDLHLIEAINGLLSTPQKTYGAARSGLAEKLSYIKLPEAILTERHPELQPVLKDLFAVKTQEVNDKGAMAIRIENQAKEFLSFFNDQFTTFAEVIRARVDSGVNDAELKHLFGEVPADTLFKKVDEFTLLMKQSLFSFRKAQKVDQLFTAWKERTNTNSPAEWSKRNGIPILCMFSSELAKAQSVFAALNKTSNLPSEKAIDDAIGFIRSASLDVLDDMAACTKEFIQYFCDDYAYVVDDADTLRATLRDIAGNDIYNWYSRKSSCKAALREMASKRYTAKYCKQAKAKVHTLTAEQAQRYLESLIENDPLLGIRILQEK